MHVTAAALGQVIASGLLLGGMIALPALGLSLVVGVVRIVNLMHGEQVALGAYLTYALTQSTHLNPFLLAPLAAVLLAALAYPIERWLLEPVRRFGEEIPLLTTFALSIVLQNLLVLHFSGNTRAIDSGLGAAHLRIAGINLPLVQLIGFGITCAMAAGLSWVVAHTHFGRAVRASAEDGVAAAIVGIPVRRVHAATFALAAGVSALGGAQLGMVFSFTPSSGVEYLLTGFAVVVLGGVGSIVGTLLAGLALGVIESLTSLWFGDGYRLFAALAAFVLFLMLRPQGLFGRRI